MKHATLPSKRQINQMTDLDKFEILASLYHDRYKVLAPGKDEGMGSGRDSGSVENRNNYTSWAVEHAWEDALKKIHSLNQRSEELERKIDYIEIDDQLGL